MEESSEFGIGGVILVLIYLAIIVAVVAGIWKVFTKAGKPGWAILVPVYNLVVMLEIANRPLWWVLLMFVPIVGFVVAIIVGIDIARAFGKGTGFGLGLTFLGFAFYPILGFGDATYRPLTR